MVNNLKHFLIGYLVVELQGRSFVGLINYLARHDYQIWDIKTESDKLYFKVSRDDFTAIKSLCTKRKYQLLVIKQEGISFYLEQLKKRKGLFLGFFLVVFLLHFSSYFLFTISIEGTKEFEKEKIRETLTELDVKRGKLKASIDKDEIEKKLLAEYPFFTWVNLHYQGTELQLRVVEKEQIESEEKASEIIASDEGVISEITVLKGSPVVGVGDVVQQGDTLITNQIIYQKEGEEQTEQIDEAKGVVKARTWQEGYGEARLENIYYQSTKESRTDIMLKIDNKEYQLKGNNTPPYTNFKVTENIKSFSKWRNIDLPLEIIIRRYNKVVAYRTKKDFASAKKIAKNRAKKSILQELSKKAIILDSNFKMIDSDDEIIRIKALLEIEDEIGQRKE